jgi:hypothetical protein
VINRSKQRSLRIHNKRPTYTCHTTFTQMQNSHVIDAGWLDAEAPEKKGICPTPAPTTLRIKGALRCGGNKERGVGSLIIATTGTSRLKLAEHQTTYMRSTNHPDRRHQSRILQTSGQTQSVRIYIYMHMYVYRRPIFSKCKQTKGR